MDSHQAAQLYDAFYFAHNLGRPYQRDEVWLQFFATIADRIVSDIRPCTVLDAGCAMGFLVEALRDRGVDAVGVDVSEYAISQVRPDMRSACWVGSVTDPFPQKQEHRLAERGIDAFHGTARFTGATTIEAHKQQLFEGSQRCCCSATTGGFGGLICGVCRLSLRQP